MSWEGHDPRMMLLYITPYLKCHLDLTSGPKSYRKLRVRTDFGASDEGQILAFQLPVSHVNMRNCAPITEHSELPPWHFRALIGRRQVMTTFQPSFDHENHQNIQRSSSALFSSSIAGTAVPFHLSPVSRLSRRTETVLEVSIALPTLWFAVGRASLIGCSRGCPTRH